MATMVREEKDELDALLSFLEAQRDAVRRALHGLSEEQAAVAPSASTLCLGGLIKHLAWAERKWFQVVLDQRPDPDPRAREHWGDYFRMLPGETLASLLADYDRVAAETERIVRALPGPEVSVPLPDAPWYPPGSRRTARWILLYMVQETARHAGHADIIRESLDGARAFELMAAVEQQEQRQAGA
jgi:hypothetical protein